MKKLIILLILIIFMFGCDFSKKNSRDRLPEQKGWVVYNNLKDNNSVSQIKDEVLRLAKRPSSVEFINWSKVNFLEATHGENIGEPVIAIVYVEFSAMNGFGGYSRSTYSFWIDFDGTVLSIMTQKDDDYDWEFWNNIYWDK